MFEFTINYSKEEKMYDVLTKLNGEYHNHFHEEDINFIRDHIKYLVS
jgi:hypothetical protein